MKATFELGHRDSMEWLYLTFLGLTAVLLLVFIVYTINDYARLT